MNLPNKALASLAAALIRQETGLWPKEPAGRQAQDSGDLYVCEPTETPGVLSLRIERDQTKYRHAIEVFNFTDHRLWEANAKKKAALEAAKVAKKNKNEPHERQYLEAALVQEERIQQVQAEFDQAAKDCPQAHYDSLTGRAQRQADLAEDFERLADKKLADAIDLEKRGNLKEKESAKAKGWEGVHTWDDQMLAVAEGCRAAHEEASAKAREARTKEREFLSQRPKCQGAEDFVDRFFVRIEVVEVSLVTVKSTINAPVSYKQLCDEARGLGFTGAFLKRPELEKWLEDNKATV